MSRKMRGLADEIVEALGGVGTRLGRSLKHKSDAQAGNIRQIILASRKLDKELGAGLPRTRVPGNHPDTVDVRVRPFRQRNYDDQLAEQINALENLSVADWVRNRARWLENGGQRSPASLAAQQQARADALKDKISELRSAGADRASAAAQASAWLKEQAATHRIDSIAGGFDFDISGVGNSGVNSSIGSQWRSRVHDLDSSVADFLRNNPDVDLSRIRMNFNFG